MAKHFQKPRPNDESAAAAGTPDSGPTIDAADEAVPVSQPAESQAPPEAVPMQETLAEKLNRVGESLPPEVKEAFLMGGAGSMRLVGMTENEPAVDVMKFENLPGTTLKPEASGAAEGTAEKPGEIFRDAMGREIKEYRRCPVCWNRHRGYGTVRSTSETKSYLKCLNALTDLGPCGFAWSVQFVEEVVILRSKRPLRPGETR